MLLLIGLSLQCTNKGGATSNKNDEDSCVTFVAEDSRAYQIFKDIYANDYGKIFSLRKDISFNPVKNAFDSAKIDSVVTIRVGKAKFKYYSRGESKVLLEATISDDSVPISNEIKIGMNLGAFEKNVLNKYFNQKKPSSANCIDISPPSDYENLHFLFVANKLASVSYTSSIESFK